MTKTIISKINKYWQVFFCLTKDYNIIYIGKGLIMKQKSFYSFNIIIEHFQRIRLTANYWDTLILLPNKLIISCYRYHSYICVLTNVNMELLRQRCFIKLIISIYNVCLNYIPSNEEFMFHKYYAPILYYRCTCYD